MQFFIFILQFVQSFVVSFIDLGLPYNYRQFFKSMYDLFPLPFYPPLQLHMIRPRNLPSFPQCVYNLHLKSLAPLLGTNFPVKGQFVINIPIKHPIHIIQTPMIILTLYLPSFPPCLHQPGLGFSFWMSSGPFIQAFVVFDCINTTMLLYDMIYKWCFVFH